MKSTMHRKGVALVTVVLVILTATAIALMSMKIVTGEIRMSSAFNYNRQATRAAHAVGMALEPIAKNNAEKTCSNQKVGAIRDSLAKGSFVSSADTATQAIDQDLLESFTGLGKKPGAKPAEPGSGATPIKTRLEGDLSRRTYLAGMTGNFTLNLQPVAGFSDGDAFSRYDMSANAYALIGSPAAIQGSGGDQYYLLSEVNARTSGFKREFGIYEVQPLSCK